MSPLNYITPSQNISTIDASDLNTIIKYISMSNNNIFDWLSNFKDYMLYQTQNARTMRLNSDYEIEYKYANISTFKNLIDDTIKFRTALIDKFLKNDKNINIIIAKDNEFKKLNVPIKTFIELVEKLAIHNENTFNWLSSLDNEVNSVVNDNLNQSQKISLLEGDLKSTKALSEKIMKQIDNLADLLQNSFVIKQGADNQYYLEQHTYRPDAIEKAVSIPTEIPSPRLDGGGDVIPPTQPPDYSYLFEGINVSQYFTSSIESILKAKEESYKLLSVAVAKLNNDYVKYVAAALDNIMGKFKNVEKDEQYIQAEIVNIDYTLKNRWEQIMSNVNQIRLAHNNLCDAVVALNNKVNKIKSCECKNNEGGGGSLNKDEIQKQIDATVNPINDHNNEIFQSLINELGGLRSRTNFQSIIDNVGSFEIKQGAIPILVEKETQKEKAIQIAQEHITNRDLIDPPINYISNITRRRWQEIEDGAEYFQYPNWRQRPDLIGNVPINYIYDINHSEWVIIESALFNDLTNTNWRRQADYNPVVDNLNRVIAVNSDHETIIFNERLLMYVYDDNHDNVHDRGYRAP